MNKQHELELMQWIVRTLDADNNYTYAANRQRTKLAKLEEKLGVKRN